MSAPTSWQYKVIRVLCVGRQRHRSVCVGTFMATGLACGRDLRHHKGKTKATQPRSAASTFLGPPRSHNGNVAPANGRVTANFTGDSMDDTLVPGACTPRAATVTTGKAPRSRVRMAPPPAIPLAPFGPGSTTPTATPTVRAPLLSAMRSSSPSAPLALSSTPVRSAPYSKRRMSPPPPLASAPRAGPSTQTGPASVMASTPPRPRQDKGKARAVSSPPSLPSQEFAVGDETVMANGDDDNDGDDTVRTEDVELSTEVLAGLGMDKFPGLTLVQPRAGHTTGRLCLPSLGLPPCVVTRKAAPKAAKAKTPRTVTILSPPTWSAPAGSRAPATPGPAPLDLGKSIRAGASVRARATAMEELAAVSGTTISAPAPVSSSATPSQAVRTPSAARVTSATAPAKTYTRASDHMIELLDEMDRQHELARQMGLPPPGCRPATQSAADFGPGDITARLERQAHIRRYGSGPSDDSDSFDSFDSFRSSGSSGTSSSSGKKRPATEFDWMHADVAPLDESLVQAFKKQRQLAPRRVFGREDSLDRLASRQTSGSPIRLDAPRRRPAAVALRGVAATGPRLRPIPVPITVVKVNGVVVMVLTLGSPAPACASFVNAPTASPPPAAVEASLLADSTLASSSESSRLSMAARSFSAEAADRSRKVKDAARRRMAEMHRSLGQRRERQQKAAQQQREAEEAARQ